MNTILEIECFLYDKYGSGEKAHIYKEPLYTKMDGIYGYLNVFMYKVFFIWSDDEGVHSDDVSDVFKVEYVTRNVTNQ